MGLLGISLNLTLEKIMQSLNWWKAYMLNERMEKPLNFWRAHMLHEYDYRVGSCRYFS